LSPRTRLRKPFFTDQEKSLIFAKLRAGNVRRGCPACAAGEVAFSVVDGVLAPQLVGSVEELSNVMGLATHFPCIGLVCTGCGFTSLYSLQSLGLDDWFAKRSA
jgi:hypothetical protein